MTTTIWKVSRGSPGGEIAGQALRDAGIGLVEKDDWVEVTQALARGEAALVLADGEAIAALAASHRDPGDELPAGLARSLSHDLRTPLSAMAGWLHLIESGKLDAAGVKRAVDKMRGNIEDQVRTIDRFLGATQEGQR